MGQSPVLYVEDEMDYQTLVSRILGKAGISVQVADTGAEGLKCLEQERPSLLMLDVNLPDTDGYSICRKLRENPAWGDLPILMLTVRRRPEEWLNGFSCGANDYVSKPLNPPELIERVQACMNEKVSRSGSDSDGAEFLLIQAAIAGNRGAFDVLIRQHKAALLYRITQQAKNAAEAEDIVSSAFLKAFEKLPEFRGESSFNTWLYTIALNELYRRSRAPAAYSLDELSQEEDGPLPRGLTMVDPDPLVNNSQTAKIEKMIASLPKRYQRVLELNVIQGVTMEDLSRRWEMPLASVKWRVAMAKRLLCKAWEKNETKALLNIR